MQALPPLRFRFHQDDHQQYGADWQTYDEAKLARIRGRELVDIETAIEAEFGRKLAEMLVRFRVDATDAKLALSWAARRMAGITEPLADYQPMVALMDWELADQEAAADDADPPAQGASTSSTPTAAPPSS